MNGVVGTHATGEGQARVIDVGRDDPGGAGGFADADGEQPDRAASGDQDERAGDVGGERRMERVAHGVVDAADLVGDLVVEVPHVGRRHRDVVREAPVAVDADDLGVGTDMGVAGAAEQAPAVDDVPFGGHPVPLCTSVTSRPTLHDVAGEFMSDDDRRLDPPPGPVIPLVDVDVRATHAGAADANQDLVFSDRRLGDLGQHHPGSRGSFHQRSHVFRAPIMMKKAAENGASDCGAGEDIVGAAPLLGVSPAHIRRLSVHDVQRCVLQCILARPIFAQRTLCTPVMKRRLAVGEKAMPQRFERRSVSRRMQVASRLSCRL